MRLIAHRSEDGREQPFEEHARGVERLAAGFGAAFGSGEQAGIAGLMHDDGKCAPAGQKRLRGDTLKVEHAAAAAEELFALGGTAAKLLAYCVAGHHTGLPDGGSSTDEEDKPTLRGKLMRQKARNGDYLACGGTRSEPVQEVILPQLDYEPQNRGFSLSFWARMIFSCLVDADFLDTEAFMENKPLRNIPQADIRLLLERLEAQLIRFPVPQNEVGRKRNTVLEDCRQKAVKPRGLFTLTVPTGGGKTLSSLAFALRHAVENGLRRVIYVIPYTSIIEQTAQVFQETLGEEAVLEHHSNVQYDRTDEERDTLRLAAENWDMPIVVTTNVQFFESLFANKTSRCRKLHNIANSVIIFDEAQMLPPDFLAPCVCAIEELVRNYRCTVVLCSATQPVLGSLFSPALRAEEICSDHKALYTALRRVPFEHIGQTELDTLADKMNSMVQALCVVNTREAAQRLYEKLDEKGSFHLSTLMTPEHRARVLKNIRERLAKGLICRVVSTSLIEAGVDVDFPCVFREEAGIDSLVQAAGRCNREGKLALNDGVVYIFRLKERYAKKAPALVKTQIGIAQNIWATMEDVASPEAIKAYFRQFILFRGDGVDIKKIIPALNECAKKGLMIPFARVASEFKVINADTYAVLIQKQERAAEIVSLLREGMSSRALMREVGRYSVSLYKNQYEALFNCGALEVLMDGFAVLRDASLYSEAIGLCVPESGGEGIYV